MSNHDEALVEKAAQVLRGLERAWGHMPDATGIDSRDAAHAVLDAVADDLRAEALERAAADPAARLSGHSGVSVRWLQREAANCRQGRA